VGVFLGGGFGTEEEVMTGTVMPRSVEVLGEEGIGATKSARA
jgi:hypothetical protein